VNLGPDSPILIVDDDPNVRAAYQKILGGAVAVMPNAELVAARQALFGPGATDPGNAPRLVLEVCASGEAAIAVQRERQAAGSAFAMAFVDMRMPPGIDGIATIQALWQLDPDLQVVLATAYSDVPWDEVVRRLGHCDRLLILKKPFDPIEAQQLAHSLRAKRMLLAALRAREQELVHRVEERTAALRRALTTAEAATQARTSFLANMSHEIRTPLTAILGYTELLREELAPVDRARHIDTIERNGSHLLAVLNDVLDLSKLEAGQLLVEAMPTALPALLQDTVELLRGTAHDKGIALSLRLEGPVPGTITTDPLRLRQILWNLLSNAVKFTLEGRVEVVARLLDGESRAPRLQLAVSDTGIGMTAAQQALLFQPFTQADTSMSRRFGGTGLGLSIARQLAERLGGDIRVVSEVGRGSTFTLTIPTGPLPEVARITTLTPLSVASPDVQPQTRERLRGRILLAEDGRDNQHLLQAILQRAGAEVAIAANGAEAVALVQASERSGDPFDLVLMDMQMPVMDGHLATRRLRELGWRGPIVALTAHAMEGDRDRCLADGCDAYETKPVKAARLVATCRQQMEARPGPQSAPSLPGD